jgi:HSP20 family protein
MIFRSANNLPAFYRRAPFGELERLKRQMELLSEGLTGRLSREPSAGVFPLMNVTEDKDIYYVRAELPGIQSEDLDISPIKLKGLESKDFSIPGPLFF